MAFTSAEPRTPVGPRQNRTSTSALFVRPGPAPGREGRVPHRGTGLAPSWTPRERSRPLAGRNNLDRSTCPEAGAPSGRGAGFDEEGAGDEETQVAHRAEPGEGFLLLRARAISAPTTRGDDPSRAAEAQGAGIIEAMAAPDPPEALPGSPRRARPSGTSWRPSSHSSPPPREGLRQTVASPRLARRTA